MMFIYQTRDALADLMTDFFEGIGIDPLAGFSIIVTGLIILRIARFVNSDKKYKEYSTLQKISDLLLFLISFSIYYVYFVGL